MAQPNPPGDIPLVEGLGTEWNDIVSAFPEDRRAELAPKIKERLSAYEPLKQWEDLQKSGITPDFADTAIRIYEVLDKNPRDVYDAIGKALGISKEEAKEVVEDIQETDAPENSQLAAMQQKLDTMAQVMLAQRDLSVKEKQQADADAALNKELADLKTKYGHDPNYNERDIVMRMMHLDMTAEEAYQDFANSVTQIQKRRPAPFVLGAGGHVPNNNIDVKKLDSAGTKSLVTQMLQHANNEAKQ